MENQEHPLKLYDSLKREVRPFVPLVTELTGRMPSVEEPVTMYNCGPTVYSYAHIGNARAAVVADVLFRVLRHIYGTEENEWKEVKYARNLTDVDDKIIASAKEQGVPISTITKKFTEIYQDDLKQLNCLAPSSEPKATEHISDMIAMIATLIESKHAYEIDGHVFFDVSKYADYGKLSGNTLEGLKTGDRVGEGEVARKRNKADFVLWKPELDGVGWDAPFGRGRPGWHIECSAMAKATLGEVIDIHCGGVDLKFPHHENEIAQSCCGNGKPEFAKFWVHNEFLNMGKEKMSKSVGNVVLVHDLLKEWDGEVIRLALLKAHYRNELVWSEDLLRESKVNLDRWYRVTELMRQKLKTNKCLEDISGIVTSMIKVDMDLSRVFNGVHVIANSVGLHHPNQGVRGSGAIVNQTDPLKVWPNQLYALRLLGLLQRDPEEWFRGNASADDSAEFDALATARHVARQAKDWAEADRIRDEGAARGIVFEDGAGGTTWRKA